MALFSMLGLENLNLGPRFLRGLDGRIATFGGATLDDR
jgi:hypothetical protein